MKSFISVAALALLAAMPAVHAHIAMLDPVPINHPKNPNADSPDTDYTAPVNSGTFPCRGHHKDSAKALTPVATWAAGSSQKFTLSSGAVHGGGSCQASFSEDGGATWKVAKSFIGNCPTESGGTFDFEVPKDVKSGQVIFGWSWFNRIGNREMYMNCASVEITGGGSGLSSYPDMLVANVGNGCTTVDNVDIDIPNPGPNVDNKSSNAAAPTGSCGSSGPKTPPSNNTPPPTSENPQTPPPAPETPPATEKPPTKPPTQPPSNQAPPPAPPAGGCTEGQIVCQGESSWALCSNGAPVPMGAVAAGTKCVNGAITKRSAIRFSAEHLARGI